MKGGIEEERIAILISSPPKILAICTISGCTGQAQKDACMQPLGSWKVADHIVAAVFDMTSSNTGQFKGASAILEEALGHPVMWYPCRRHIAERHIKRTQKN